MKFNLQLKVTQTEGGSGPFLSRDLAICLHKLNFTQNLIFAPFQSYICLRTRSGKRRDWQTTKSTVATEVSSDDVQNEIAFFRDKQKCVCSRWQRRGAYLGYSERGWNTHATHVTKHRLNLGTNLYFECMSHKAEQYKCINTSIKTLHF